MKSLTIAITSYQRAEPLLRLLHALAGQLSEPSVGDRVDIVVVIDGSTDGSLRAVRNFSSPVPLCCHYQDNHGLVSARNAGLRLAQGELVWFLDDDLNPSEGLVLRHRVAHEQGPPHFVLGPCRPSPGTVADEAWLKWWDDHFAELARRSTVDRFDLFTVANMSGPTEVLRSVGGFDETFAGYGFEDYELGYRLLKSGAVVSYEPDAVAWHDYGETERESIRRERSIARNTVAFARLHPETLGTLFPGGFRGRMNWLLGHSRIKSPSFFEAVSVAAAWLVGHPWLPPGQGRRLIRDLAHAASFAAGIAETCPSLLPVVLFGDSSSLPGRLPGSPTE